MQSQSDQIRNDIVEQIQSGKLIPGDSIDVAALCKTFDVSGTPVRDALTQLEAIGLIERTQRSGAKVFRPDTERLLGLIEIYSELEGLTAAFAAKRIENAQAKRLMGAVTACEEDVKRPDFEPGHGYYALNVEFHLSIIEAANSPDLSKLMLDSATRVISFLRARHRLTGEPQRSAKEHRDIAENIISGNAEGARILMIKHVQIDADTILGTIRKMNERFD